MQEHTPPEETQVLIIGFGPAGATLAALLGRFGIDTLVIDKNHEILPMPRAIALDNEALRVLQMVGLDEQAFARLPISQVNMLSPLLGRFANANTRGSLDGHPKLVTFYQPELEQALRKQVTTYPCVQFHGGWELLNLRQDADGVQALMRDTNGVERLVMAKHLVGADGASSRVRSLIGEDFQGKTYAEDWLIVDAKQRQGAAIDHVEFICDPRRSVPHMPAPGGRERWEFMLKPGETREEMENPAKITALMAPWAAGQKLDIERTAVYRFHARCCKHFSKGRVFLAGDAAHITPPFVGQGLVAGLRDVANLAWKLAWVNKGYAAPKILLSYDQERRPHAWKMIQLARFMGHLIMTRNSLSALIIHGLMKLIRGIAPLRRHLEELKIKPTNRFSQGLFVCRSRSDQCDHGAQLTQNWVRWQEQIQLSDDVLGSRLLMLGFGCNPQTLLSPAIHQRWAAAGGEYLQIGMQGESAVAEDLSNQLSAPFTQARVLVVRPDKVIMADAAPEDAALMLKQCLALLV